MLYSAAPGEAEMSLNKAFPLGDYLVTMYLIAFLSQHVLLVKIIIVG